MLSPICGIDWHVDDRMAFSSFLSSLLPLSRRRRYAAPETLERKARLAPHFLVMSQFMRRRHHWARRRAKSALPRAGAKMAPECSAAATRRMGPSRSSKADSHTCAVISPAMPPVRVSSVPTRSLFVQPHRIDKGLAVERPKRAQVQHFSLDALASQPLGGFGRHVNHGRIGGDRQVTASGPDYSLPQRHGAFRLRRQIFFDPADTRCFSAPGKSPDCCRESPSSANSGASYAVAGYTTLSPGVCTK